MKARIHMARRRRPKQPLKVESLTHEAAGRPNIPSAEHQPLLKDDERDPIQAAFERRNPDLDPQLVWRGKDPADWSDLVTQAPPLYIQEKVSPKALIDDLRRSGQNAKRRSNWTSSPTSTGCRRAPTAPTSTSTGPTGRTA